MSYHPTQSPSHLVLIPSYNTGPQLRCTIQSTLDYWKPVWVVIDGSTDGSDQMLAGLHAKDADFRILQLPSNQGKGAAVLAGMKAARRAGFTHALVMDADGQHPPSRVPEFMSLSHRNPAAMILGEPQFAAEAPFSRRYGRLAGNWWTHLETLWGGINDSLFGFRVYPLKESIEVLDSIRGGRGYDFDTQLAVRLYWTGLSAINVPVPVKYLSASEGGVSHFRYLRHNALLFRAHFGLVLGMLARLPGLWRRRRRQ